MEQEYFSKEQFWADLEKLGEEQTRIDLDRTKYGPVGTDRYALASQWLRKREDARNDASNREHIATARSAKNAAWIAAIAAIAAAILTVVMLFTGP